MTILWEWKNGNNDITLKNVKEYNECVHDRKIYVSYNDDKENESYSMIQYMAVPLNWLIYVKKKGRDCMSNRPSYYRNDEIKYKIDTAIQMVMFEKGKENWDTLLEVQDKLYDEFGLSIE